VSRWLSTLLRRIGLAAERFAHGAHAVRVQALSVLHTRSVPMRNTLCVIRAASWKYASIWLSWIQMRWRIMLS
jgi:hypothetical protein